MISTNFPIQNKMASFKSHNFHIQFAFLQSTYFCEKTIPAPIHGDLLKNPCQNVCRELVPVQIKSGQKTPNILANCPLSFPHGHNFVPIFARPFCIIASPIAPFCFFFSTNLLQPCPIANKICQIYECMN
jgi:hypothetical protein